MSATTTVRRKALSARTVYNCKRLYQKLGNASETAQVMRERGYKISVNSVLNIARAAGFSVRPRGNPNWVASPTA